MPCQLRPSPAHFRLAVTGFFTVTLRRFQRLMAPIETTRAAQRLLLVEPRRLVPDIVGHGVRAVAHPGDGFRERQRCALGLAEIGRVAPGGDGEDALVALAGLLELARVHVGAEAAAVDLARAQMDELPRHRRQVVAVRRLLEGEKRPCIASGSSSAGLFKRGCMADLLSFHTGDHVAGEHLPPDAGHGPGAKILTNPKPETVSGKTKPSRHVFARLRALSLARPPARSSSSGSG